MTARGRGLTVAAVLLWIVARSFGIPQLQVAAAAALLLVVGSALWVGLRPVRLRARRTLTPGRTHVAGQVALHLQLRAYGRRSTPPLRLRTQIPSGLVPPLDVTIPALRRAAHFSVVDTIVPSRRGHHPIGPTVVDFSDPFGLTTRRRPIAPSVDLIVYPAITTLAPGLPLGGGTGAAGIVGRQTASVGDELADIREYVRGDDLRAVHWPSTARRGVLMVRRDEIGGASSAVIVLDRRRQRHHGHGSDSSFECAVSVAASAGAHLVGRGRSVIVLTDPVRKPPRPQPWSVSLEELAGVQTGPTDVRGLFGQVAEGAVDGGTLVAVVTTPSSKELRDLVRAGQAFAVRVVIVIDSSSFAASGTRSQDPAAEQAAALLRGAGWHATAMHRGDLLAQRWQELIAPPPAAPGVG